MINRTLLRIKVIQIIYSYFKSESNNVALAEKELFFSIEKTYQLYYNLIRLSVSITNYAAAKIDNNKNKFRPTEEELHPNTRFIDNTFVQQVSLNKALIELHKADNFSWEEQGETIKQLYDAIVEQDFYKDYMNAKSVDYNADKEIWRKIYKRVLLVDENFDEAIEDISIYWTDDLEIILSFVIKTIKKFEEENGADQSILPMFRDDEDREFAEKLLRTAIENSDDYKKIIDENTKNWELDRIAFMDIIIMEVALAEIMSFPTIPVNVTLNEYIEISKNYSTDKSATFINGVLDNIVKKMKAENKLIKVVKV